MKLLSGGDNLFNFAASHISYSLIFFKKKKVKVFQFINLVKKNLWYKTEFIKKEAWIN